MTFSRPLLPLPDLCTPDDSVCMSSPEAQFIQWRKDDEVMTSCRGTATSPANLACLLALVCLSPLRPWRRARAPRLRLVENSPINPHRPCISMPTAEGRRLKYVHVDRKQSLLPPLQRVSISSYQCERHYACKGRRKSKSEKEEGTQSHNFFWRGRPYTIVLEIEKRENILGTTRRGTAVARDGG